MFHQARIRLTIFYSLLFLSIIWILSIGAYFWTCQFFDLRYQQEVHTQYLHEKTDQDAQEYDWQLSRIASNLALDRFKTLLLVINGGLLVIIPLSAWFITGQSLKPVEAAHKREQQFVSDVSHDLRTPLSIMSGELEVALRKKRPAAEYKSVIQSNKEEVDRLSSLVENLLFLTRQQSSHLHVAMTAVDITDLISTTVSRFSPSLQQNDIALRVKPAKETIEVKGNPLLLDQLFTNLIENSIQYSKKHGTININISSMDTHTQAIIKIQDNGIGIAPEHQQHIFDRFYRVDSSRTQKGYGLGLAIVRTIVDLHYGKIEVNSKVNKGTTFTVTLPLTDNG